MQFVPLWTSILRSRKVAELPDELFRTWVLCLAVAQEHDYQTGSLPSIGDLSYILHIEKDECFRHLSRLVTLRHIDVADGIYLIHDWKDWKVKIDTTAAERKRKSRAQLKDKKEVASMDENSTKDNKLNWADVTDVTLGHKCHSSIYNSNSNSNSRCNSPPYPPVTDVTPKTASVAQTTHSSKVATSNENAVNPLPRVVTGENHSTDSPAASKVRDQATARWGSIDVDAEIQANELIRSWGAVAAGQGVDKAFRKLGVRERPWAYAAQICRSSPPPPPPAAKPKYVVAPADPTLWKHPPKGGAQ